MSGYKSKTVKFHDSWDCGKADSKEESYHLEYNGTSDVIVFIREYTQIVSLSKGDAWLFMKALEDFMENEEASLARMPNPFTRGVK